MSTAAKINTPAPLVSVAMITFNHRPYIERAVKCVLNQETDFNVELVIGEDCSTDGTRELVFDLQRRHPELIRIVTSEHNVGAQNILRTERACRGKYLAYCEGDDFWSDPSKLAKQVAFLESRPDYVMVHSNCHRYVVAEQRLLRNNLTVSKQLDDTKAYEDLLLGRRLMMTLTVVARREKLQRVLETCPECSDPKWPMGDTQRWLELSRLGNVGCIHEALATKNMLAESASSSQDARKLLRFFLAARELHLHYLNKYPASAELNRAVRKNLALALLHHAYQACDPLVADAMYEDYVAQTRHSLSRGRWLRWGSRSPLRQRLVSPFVKAELLWRRLRRRMQLKGTT
jgi:glycosyltransferase involved in cell wall biosynthesis